MPRTVTTRDRGNLIQFYQDGAQTLNSHGIQTQIVCVLLRGTQKGQTLKAVITCDFSTIILSILFGDWSHTRKSVPNCPPDGGFSSFGTFKNFPRPFNRGVTNTNMV